MRWSQRKEIDAEPFIFHSNNPEQFYTDYADAWYKLVHRFGGHPHEDDLEKDSGKCTAFGFANTAKYV